MGTAAELAHACADVVGTDLYDQREQRLVLRPGSVSMCRFGDRACPRRRER
jgi:hypothetical protein